MQPLNREQARARFRATLEGRHVPRRDLGLDEAKARLRAVDEDLDIGPVLAYLSQGRRREALLALAAWLGTDSGRAFVAPLLMRLLPLGYRLLGMLRGAGRDAAKAGAAMAGKPPRN
ncbi:hypothetical protein QVG61_06925 [Thiohalobacter sp. IOR34]|uniref:hypothetical protein n=1 Tax=Thiohalobacter sp. IOR34 TaxID=3057176 RepID=UPI0025B03E0B|nr:hypothetical protein [Thiohalobacter sp. IOR34]WJW74257.1 hypothetical protein QVG61_06925 [Thiohalobacter sp. IOR34]